MKKYISLFLILFFISACDENCIDGNNNYVTKEFQLATFKNVVNSFSGTVHLKYGDPKIEIHAESNLIDLIDLEISDNTLNLGTKDDECFSTSNGINFTIYSNDFSYLKNNGSAKWTSDSLSINPDIKINGSGDFKLNGESDTQNILINGSGNVDLSNMPTNDIEIKINGSGDLIAIAKNDVDILINGSGNVTIDSIQGTVNITINGSGNFYYSGNPEFGTISTKGSGQIIKK